MLSARHEEFLNNNLYSHLPTLLGYVVMALFSVFVENRCFYFAKNTFLHTFADYFQFLRPKNNQL